MNSTANFSDYQYPRPEPIPLHRHYPYLGSQGRETLRFPAALKGIPLLLGTPILKKTHKGRLFSQTLVGAQRIRLRHLLRVCVSSL